MPVATYTTIIDDSHGRNQQTYDSQEVLIGGNITPSPRKLLEFTGVNTSGSTRYIMLFDADSIPAPTAVPKVCPVPVASGAAFTYTPPGGYLQFTTGITWASSSTFATLTITGAADVWLTAAHI